MFDRDDDTYARLLKTVRAAVFFVMWLGFIAAPASKWWAYKLMIATPEMWTSLFTLVGVVFFFKLFGSKQ